MDATRPQLVEELGLGATTVVFLYAYPTLLAQLKVGIRGIMLMVVGGVGGGAKYMPGDRQASSGQSVKAICQRCFIRLDGLSPTPLVEKAST